MIRQAISCDICGAEKKQTNHWFVASEQGGELRVSGWSSRNRLRVGSKHLCGQVCLHKLADEFMARVIAGKSIPQAESRAESGAEGHASRIAIESGPIASAGSAAVDSSARLLTPVEPPGARAAFRPELVPRLEKDRSEKPIAPFEEPSHSSTHARRAEAWERERERAARSSDHRAGIVPCRLSQV